MSKVAKFVLILMESAQQMEIHALRFYSRLFSSDESGREFVNDTLSAEKLFKLQNDFSVEIVMVMENETAGSFMKLNSSWLSNMHAGGKKPLRIEQAVYFDTEELALLFDRTEAIAKQRGHDLVWVNVFEVDAVLKEFLGAVGYKIFDLEKEIQSNSQVKILYYRKEIISQI